MNKTKEPFMIEPITHVNEKGETTLQLKVYSEKNPKIWMLFEPNKENPEKLDLIKKSKNKMNLSA